MALQQYTVFTGAAITTNTTTTFVVPGVNERAYIHYIGADTLVAGTAWLAKVQGSSGNIIAAVFSMSALGHQEALFDIDDRAGSHGLALPVQDRIEIVTTGTTPGTASFTIVYSIRGG